MKNKIISISADIKTEFLETLKITPFSRQFSISHKLTDIEEISQSNCSEKYLDWIKEILTEITIKIDPRKGPISDKDLELLASTGVLTRLDNALLELLKNAYDACVSAYDFQLKRPILHLHNYQGTIRLYISLSEDKKQLIIEITDNGLGNSSATTEDKRNQNKGYFGKRGVGLRDVNSTAIVAGGTFVLQKANYRNDNPFTGNKLTVAKLIIPTSSLVVANGN